MNDENEKILILEVTLDDNANAEQHQLETLQNPSILPENDDNYDKNVILASGFNIFFNKKLECKGGRPIIKKQSVSHIIKLQETFDLCDIWRIRNPKKMSFIFRQKHFYGTIQRILDYLFISNSLQETISSVDILKTLSTDHKMFKFCERPGFLEI